MLVWASRCANHFPCAPATNLGVYNNFLTYFGVHVLPNRTTANYLPHGLYQGRPFHDHVFLCGAITEGNRETLMNCQITSELRTRKRVFQRVVWDIINLAYACMSFQMCKSCDNFPCAPATNLGVYNNFLWPATKVPLHFLYGCGVLHPQSKTPKLQKLHDFLVTCRGVLLSPGITI